MTQLPKEILYDTRLIERHLQKGLLTRKELEKHLKECVDVEPEGEWQSLAELMDTASGQSDRAMPMDAKVAQLALGSSTGPAAGGTTTSGSREIADQPGQRLTP